MKFLYKGILVASLAVCMTTVTALADEVPSVPSAEENISFDYQTNMFDIDAGTGVATNEELTVMLVKGDYTADDISLANIDVANVYYVGQQPGTNYDIFDDLGVKYDSDKFAPGVYTLITSGETIGLKKTKLVIGNALDKGVGLGSYLPRDWNASDYTFGSVGNTARYYPEDNDGKYIYVCYATFPAVADFDNAGFVFQNISATSTKHLVKTLNQFNLDFMDGINSIDAGIEIGVQVNDIPTVGANAVDNIVAIPYVKNASIGG